MKLYAAPKSVTRDEVRALHKLYSLMRDKGAQDFAASSLIRALEIQGRAGRARAIFRNYVSRYRRERFPLLQDLEDFADRLSGDARARQLRDDTTNSRLSSDAQVSERTAVSLA
jgi:hypothetical protein